MARELTDGYPLAAHIPERFIARIFAKAFLRLLPMISRSVDGQTLDVWFKTPTARLVHSTHPLENLIEAELPLLARLSERGDETHAVFRTRPNLIQVEIDFEGRRLIAPMVDFRPTASTAFTVDADVDAYEPVLLATLGAALRAISPFTAAPLFPAGDRQFFLRSYTTAAGTADENVLALFITNEPAPPPLPARIDPQNGGPDEAAVLVPRDLIDARMAAGLAAAGLGTLPAVLPGDDGLVLLSLAIDLRVGHVFMSGRVRAEVLGLESDVAFRAWLQLLVNDDAITVNVLRAEQDGDAVFDVLDLFTAGALTRMMEEVLPAAIGSVGGGAFGGVGLFAGEVPIDQGYASVRSSGVVGVSPAGVEIPVRLVDDSSATTISPAYLRAHWLSREFHVAAGCPFGDLIKRPRRFPTWKAAIAAGFNGCSTCQPGFNVVAAGDFRLELAGAPAAGDGDDARPSYELAYTGSAKRFGVPIGPLREVRKNLRGGVDEAGEAKFADGMDFLVPGPWTLTVRWDGWSVSGPVDVHKRWLDAAGHTQGERTLVTVRKGDDAFTVTHL